MKNCYVYRCINNNAALIAVVPKNEQCDSSEDFLMNCIKNNIPVKCFVVKSSYLNENMIIEEKMIKAIINFSTFNFIIDITENAAIKTKTAWNDFSDVFCSCCDYCAGEKYEYADIDKREYMCDCKYFSPNAKYLKKINK